MIIILYLCHLKHYTKILWENIYVNFYSPNFQFQTWTSLIVFPACVLKDFKIFCFYILSVCLNAILILSFSIMFLCVENYMKLSCP